MNSGYVVPGDADDAKKEMPEVVRFEHKEDEDCHRGRY